MASVRVEPEVPRHASIRAHLLGLVLVVALPLAAVMSWILYDSAQADSRHARQQVLHVAQVTASETTKFLGRARNILSGLAARPAVSDLDPSRCDPVLKDFLGVAPRFSNFITTTIDGGIVCSAAPLAGPTRVDPDILLKRLRNSGQVTVGRITPGTITRRWAVPIGWPLVDARGDIVGAVGVSVDLLTLPVLPSLEGLPANAIVSLIAGDGTVLARSIEPERYIGTKAGADLAALRERSGTVEVVGIDGIARIQGFVPVPGTDWIAIASMPASTVLAGSRARLAASALIAVAVLLAVLLFAIRLGRQIHEPISAIAHVADEVAAGNIAARAPVAGASEIVHVAAQFNAMLDARAGAEAELRESEARFRSLTELSSDFYWEQDEELRFTARVGQSQSWSYPKAEDVIGKKRWELPALNLDEEDWQRHRADLDARREFRDLEILRPRQTGEMRWIRSSGRPIFDVKGRFCGYRGIGRDITERKRAEDQLRRSESGLAAAQFHARLGNWEFDLATNEMFWSKEMYRLFARDEALGPPSRSQVLEFIHPADREKELEDGRRAVKTGEPNGGDFRTNPEHGPVRYLTFTRRAVRDGSGRTLRLEGTAQDVTERVRAAEALRESEAGLRQAGQLARLTHGVTRGDGSFESWAEELPDMVGMHSAQMPRSTREWLTMLHPGDRKAFRDRSIESAKRGTRFDMEYRLRRGDGSLINIRHVAEPIREDSGAAGRARWFCTVQDVTAHRRDAILIAGQRQTLEMIASGAPLEWSLDSLIRVLEGLVPDMIGSVLILGEDGSHLRHGAAPSLPQSYIQAIDGVAIGPCVGSCGTAAYRREQVIVEDIAGDPLWADFRDLALSHGLRACWSTPIFDAGRRVAGTFAMYFREPRRPTEEQLRLVEAATDLAAIAINKAREEAALSTAAQRLRDLSRRLLEVQDTERRSIARELHDEVGGVLTAVKLNLQSLRGKPAGRAADAALADGLALVDGAIQSVRSLSLDLHPAVLDDLGLIPALKWYCGRTAQRAAVPIELELNAIDLKAAPQLENACFRIVQEAVTNALRHAGASSIRVALRRSDDNFALEIADDGAGFEEAVAHRHALAGESGGLLGMEERVKLLGGRFEISTAPGAGTRVRAEFAVPEGGFG